MAEVDAFSTAIFLFGTLILSFVILIVALSMARSRMAKAKRVEVSEESIEDRAYNALVTSEAISNDLRQKGFESARASDLLVEARQAYYEGRLREAEELSMEARAIMIRLREESQPEPETEEPIQLDEEIPESKPLLGKQFPKNYLQAKFFLNVVKDNLGNVKGSSAEAKKARKLMKEAQTAFDEERYTEALSLAISCNRILKGEEVEGEDGKQDVQEENHEAQCPHCGALFSQDDAFCGKCGGQLVSSPVCPECGAGVEADDNFCRKCGTALRIIEASG
jgi:ribosomal protein L40E